MPATPPYAELHAHSAYSFLDGASLPEELAERAAQLGHGALAICDHDSLAGAMELSVASRGLPVRAIFGCELTVEAPGGREARRRAHLTLLAESRRGWRSLCRLVTLAHAGTREGPERRAGRPGVALEDVLGHAEGLVCLSGCAHHGVHDEAGLRALREAFGTERLRVELQRPFERHDRARNTALARLARRLELRTVATGNVHAHTPARACLQDALVAIRCGMTLDASEGERRANHSHVLASPQQMTGRFADHPEAAAESVALAERLTFDLRGDLGYRYPMAGRDEATRTLQGICGARLGERYGQGHRHREEAEARLERELSIIARLGLSGFFLLHHEILELAREVAAEVRGSGGAGGADSPRALLPPGRGRGSSVSSLVCYLTGLSHIDPIASELAIGRFLHEEIAGLPDIDIDFPRDVREVLIPRIMERYGTDRAALVAAFPTYRTRGAIRELGKALGLPSGELERLARGAEAWGSGAAAAEEVERALGKRSRGGRWAWLVRLCREAYGLPRHISQHPGGMVIATRPLIDCCPIVPAAMEGRQMVQWDKDSCADAGFLKIDLLSLGMLSAVERAVELVAEHEGERIDLSRIPFDDAETFAAIGAAETMGVFQIESRAQMGSLRRTRPQSLADLTIQVALVRPGPVVGGAVNPYIERRRRLMADPSYEPPHLHGSLRGCLSETLGTIIFQDQVLEVASAFAGYGAGEAESLRRAMSRKRSREAIERHRRRFTAGALARHPDVDEGLAERVWRMVAGFAGFGFPKAHGAAFGLLAYQSTWLRVHHPAAFLCALLNEQPMGFYAPDSLIAEARRRGVDVLGVDVNESEAECTLDSAGAIRLGLSYVKGVGAEEVGSLLVARGEGGAFAGPADLAARSGLARASLERLAWAGACGSLGAGAAGGRREALWELGVATPARRGPAGTQLALDLDLGDRPGLRPLPSWEAMVADYGTMGLSLEHHPLALLRAALGARGALTTTALAERAHGSEVLVGGLVIARQRPATAKGVTFLLLEDEWGTVNVIVPPALYERRRLAIRAEPLLLARGRLERHPEAGGAINLLAGELCELRESTEETAEPARLEVRGSRSEDGATGPAGQGEELRATGTEGFAPVAPPVTSFARGRRR